jgi:hypothetical protein
VMQTCASTAAVPVTSRLMADPAKLEPTRAAYSPRLQMIHAAPDIMQSALARLPRRTARISALYRARPVRVGEADEAARVAEANQRLPSVSAMWRLFFRCLRNRALGASNCRRRVTAGEQRVAIRLGSAAHTPSGNVIPTARPRDPTDERLESPRGIYEPESRTVRLAEGLVRPVMADHSRRHARIARRRGQGADCARNPGLSQDEEVRY